MQTLIDRNEAIGQGINVHKNQIPTVQKIEPIQQLFANIDNELRTNGAGKSVVDIMKKYLANHDDWKSYMHFNDIKYARNLVGANDMFELMVICWLPGQASPIHNHAGQHCWAAVLEGTICETHYHFSATHSAFGEGPLEVVDEHCVSAGDVSYINDDIALHVLKPGKQERVATLHCYSKPIAECNLYCPATGTITKRQLGFYTINKKIQPQNYQCCGSTK